MFGGVLRIIIISVISFKGVQVLLLTGRQNTSQNIELSPRVVAQPKDIGGHLLQEGGPLVDTKLVGGGRGGDRVLGGPGYGKVMGIIRGGLGGLFAFRGLGGSRFDARGAEGRKSTVLRRGVTVGSGGGIDEGGGEAEGVRWGFAGGGVGRGGSKVSSGCSGGGGVLHERRVGGGLGGVAGARAGGGGANSVL